MKTVDRSKLHPKKVKRTFLKHGTCSQTFAHLVNQAFDSSMPEEERAADVLAGGILQKGCQCGMIWGASLAIGAEAYRQYGSSDRAIALAILGTQHVVQSFEDRTGTINCYEFTNCDFKNKWSYAKYMITGKFWDCFKLAEHWAPEAIEAANKSLSKEVNLLPEKCISCATEVARKMGASDREMVMVAGFAGGLGLSGGGCGALSAAIWMNSLHYNRATRKRSQMFNPNAMATLEAFENELDGQILCRDIAGRLFESLDSHTAYIEEEGCEELIEMLAETREY